MSEGERKERKRKEGKGRERRPDHTHLHQMTTEQLFIFSSQFILRKVRMIHKVSLFLCGKVQTSQMSSLKTKAALVIADITNTYTEDQSDISLNFGERKPESSDQTANRRRRMTRI